MDRRQRNQRRRGFLRLPGDRAARWRGGYSRRHSRCAPDFKAIKDWHGAALGGNAYGASAESRLVLLLRSEVLHRYPSTTIYAVKAVCSGSQRVLGTEEHYPLFRGTVEPDITFFGFAMTEAE